MDCQHDSDEMTACSMNCCQTPEKNALTALAFVLPRPEMAAEVAEIAATVKMERFDPIPSFRKPLSPPPRFAAVVL